jgi:hypothetical protein
VIETDVKTFLETVPPYTTAALNGAESSDGSTPVLASPDVQLYCDTCSGSRTFWCNKKLAMSEREPAHGCVVYICRNCFEGKKVFAISLQYHSEDRRRWHATKLGELPPFGPRTPSAAISLIGPDRDLLLKGRRCESQGLGIGAFVYYRRVVENQKNRILDEIIKVATQLNCESALIADVAKAKEETQFTTAVDSIKHAIPPSLYVNGYNPLKLLHSALSEGVHEHSDDECLELAASVRAVLFDFAEKLAAAMKNEKELADAVSRLANKKKSTQ